MRWPMGLPAFDDLAQRIGLTPDDLLCQVAAHPDLIRQIEHALTLQAQLRQPAETVTLLLPGAERPTIATLRMTDRLVQARTPERDQRLVDLAKGAGYQWVDGWWVLVAYREGKAFVGTELNKRRLANLLQRIARLGGDVQRY